MFMITPLPGVPLKPGSGHRPFPGIEADIVRRGRPPGGGPGTAILVLKRPWPAMAAHDLRRRRPLRQPVLERFPGRVLLTGDSARKDDDGYFWIIGRVDDVIKVSGYRLGTAEVESALVSHPEPWPRPPPSAM
jgi:acetyl-CoA synthetase